MFLKPVWFGPHDGDAIGRGAMMDLRTLTTFSVRMASDRQPDSPRMVLVACLIVIVTVIAGCQPGDVPPSSDSADSVRPEKRDGPNALETTPAAVMLEHDFGLLRVAVDKTAEHRFPIHNDSSTTWTLRKIVNTCSCTITQLSASAIAPGKTEHATVVYKVGNSTRDDSRDVALLFVEREAPRVILRIKCRVREQLTITPARLAFQKLGKGETGTRSFEIQNYGAADWGTLSLHSPAPWISSSFFLVEPLVGSNSGKEVDSGSPRQVWRATVVVDGKQLLPGRYEGSVLVEPVDADLPPKSVPVLAEVVSPVVAVPQQLFFGKVNRGDSAVCSISLRFSPGSVPRNYEAVEIVHDIADQLKFRWAENEGENWRLVATLTPSGRVISQKPVRITFPGSTLPQIELPVYVMVGE